MSGWIIMPHVSELKFHKPSADEYNRWERKLERPGYEVSANTRVCSNHFRYGKPLHNNNVPTIHMRSYPPWAVSMEKVREQLGELNNDIVCEVLSCLCQHGDQKDIHALFIKHLGPSVSISDCASHAIQLDKSVAHEMIKDVQHVVPIGKCLEVLAYFSHGIELEGCKRPMRSSLGFSSMHNLETSGTVTPKESYNIGDIHNYCSTTSSIPTTDHDYSEPAAPDIENDIPPSVIKASCKKLSCKNKIEELEAKVKSLEQETATLKTKLALRTQERNDNQEKIDILQKQLSEVKAEKKSPKLNIDMLKDSDALMSLNTGLPNFALFNWLFLEVENVAKKMSYWNGSGHEAGESQGKKCGPSRTLSLQNELLISLMKLKLNISGDFLAFLFDVSSSTISSIISTWLPMLSEELCGLIYWPTREEIKACYPPCFRKWEGITAIIDCFEIPTARPSHVEANSLVFSSYKNRPTTKFLLACTPGGSISFISSAAGGNMSDKELVLQSGILDNFSPGDQCMADKGFKIQGELLERGAQLIIPPFVRGGKPFTEEENSLNKNIAHSRIHVERVIGRLRDFTFLNGVIPVNQMDLVTPAVRVCCALTNLKKSVVKN